MKDLLLLSNSSGYGRPILEHARSTITQFLDGIDSIVFIPDAKRDHDAYEAKVSSFFESLNIKIVSIHKNDPKKAINTMKAIYIPGGNTFRLLNELYRKDILDLIRERVESGVKYIGSSAGAVVACPTVMTTNDMPIVFPPSLQSFGFIPFQLNCHFIEADPNSTHMGETREMRINEFHELNDIPVLGLREETWLQVKGSEVVLKGALNAILFQKGKESQIIQPEEVIKV